MWLNFANIFLYFRGGGGGLFSEVWKKILEEKTPPSPGGRGGPFLEGTNWKQQRVCSLVIYFLGEAKWMIGLDWI